MKRITFILLISLSAYPLFGHSYPIYPLIVMIERSDFIFQGTIIDVTETDSTLQDTYNYRKLDRKFYSCYDCNKTTRFRINKTYKGEIFTDTITILYHFNRGDNFPKFSLNDSIILFLNRLDNSEYYVLSDPRFGYKMAYLSIYNKLISEYMIIDKIQGDTKSKLTFDWLVDLSTISELSWEGTKVLRALSDTYDGHVYFLDSISVLDNLYNPVYDDKSKSKLTDALLSMGDLNSDNQYLFDIVIGFGFNPKVISFCTTNLRKNINKEPTPWYYYSLMDAINQMDSRRKYKKLIQEYFNNKGIQEEDIRNREQTKVIETFLKETEKHYAQQYRN